ncbi:hypothetical protein HAX54_020896, partial [Datura stramonium]|nr:hypothetical protein [Datura stramonium]
MRSINFDVSSDAVTVTLYVFAQQIISLVVSSNPSHNQIYKNGVKSNYKKWRAVPRLAAVVTRGDGSIKDGGGAGDGGRGSGGRGKEMRG